MNVMWRFFDQAVDIVGMDHLTAAKKLQRTGPH
jgi:hypothetical protein